MIARGIANEERRSASSGVFAFWGLQFFFRAARREIVRSSIRRTSYDSCLSKARGGAALDVERREGRFESKILIARFCQAPPATNMMDSARCCASEPFAKRNEAV